MRKPRSQGKNPDLQVSRGRAAETMGNAHNSQTLRGVRADAVNRGLDVAMSGFR